MGTILMALGSVGLALCGLFAIAVMLHVVSKVLPHDPPPLVDGESIHSRLVKLPPPIRHNLRW